MGRLLAARGIIQPKLRVGAINDPLEREADRVADQVMRMPEPTVQRACCASCASGSSCADDQIRRDAGPGPALPHGGSVDASLVTNLGPGRPLSPADRAFFEPRFGADFSDVRLHTGPQAQAAARAIDARAFTCGGDIALADPRSPQPDLLAHELVHVVQQRTLPSLEQGSSIASQRCLHSRSFQNNQKSLIQRQLGGGSGSIIEGPAAGGCGICYGEKLGRQQGLIQAGREVHRLLQAQLQVRHPGTLMEYRLDITNSRSPVADFAVEGDLGPQGERHIKIGEIKPSSGSGFDAGLDQLDRYKAEIELRFPDAVIKPLSVTFRPEVMWDPWARQCPEQVIFVYHLRPGLHSYECFPPFSEARRSPGCRCSDQRRRRREQQVHAFQSVREHEERRQRRPGAESEEHRRYPGTIQVIEAPGGQLGFQFSGWRVTESEAVAEIWPQGPGISRPLHPLEEQGFVQTFGLWGFTYEALSQRDMLLVGMRPDLRDQVAAIWGQPLRFASSSQLPSWAHPDALNLLNSAVDRTIPEGITVAVFPGVAPFGDQFVWAHAGTVVHMEIYREKPEDVAYYSTQVTEGDRFAARLFARSAAQLNRDMRNLVVGHGMVPSEARSELRRIYREVFLLMLMATSLIMEAGADATAALQSMHRQLISDLQAGRSDRASLVTMLNRQIARGSPVPRGRLRLIRSPGAPGDTVPGATQVFHFVRRAA